MKAFLAVLTIGALVATAAPVQAAGCLSGAAVGGVAGHVAGHHGLLGAAAGCAVGHHQNVKNQRALAAQRNTQQAPSDTQGNTQNQ